MIKTNQNTDKHLANEPTKIRRIPKPCRNPTCGAKVEKELFCEDCKNKSGPAIHNYTTRTEQKKFYSSATWQKLRLIVLRKNPICQICSNAPACHVDHITRISRGGAALDESNLQALCRPCHSKKTNAE